MVRLDDAVDDATQGGVSEEGGFSDVSGLRAQMVIAEYPCGTTKKGLGAQVADNHCHLTDDMCAF